MWRSKYLFPQVTTESYNKNTCISKYLEHLIGMQSIGNMRCRAVILLEEFRKRAETRIQKPRI